MNLQYILILLDLQNTVPIILIFLQYYMVCLSKSLNHILHFVKIHQNTMPLFTLHWLRQNQQIIIKFFNNHLLWHLQCLCHLISQQIQPFNFSEFLVYQLQMEIVLAVPDYYHISIILFKLQFADVTSLIYFNWSDNIVTVLVG